MELFNNYKSENLPKTIDTQNQIIDILETKHRSFNCFEANICQCHRKHLAEATILNPRFKYKMKTYKNGKKLVLITCEKLSCNFSKYDELVCLQGF